MLTAYRVKNLRSIRDSDFLEIRPIVVFVGKNSSGKSTLLRMFPLIKQSVSEETREPILWYGKSADFGSFEEAVSTFSTDREISFEFRFQISGAGSREMLLPGDRVYFYADGTKFFIGEDPTTVEIAIAIRKRNQSEGAYTSGIEVRINGDTLSLAASESGELESVHFNSKRVHSLPVVNFRYGQGRFFPNLIVKLPQTTAPDEFRRSYMSEGPYFETLVDRLQPFLHGNTKPSTLRKYADRISFGSVGQFAEHVSQLARSLKWKQMLKFDDPDAKREVEALRVAALLRHLPLILREASNQISLLGSGVRYLEPVRARAARYYRFQELAIDEIDPQGENVPMFVSSLNYSDRESLEDWMTEAMGFRVRASREGGHAKLVIKEAGSDREINLADTGFGYSQVLPIILQLWKIERDAKRGTARRSARQQVVLAVEQPELHLHPQFQAVLADIFALSVKAAKAAAVSLSLAVETHSEHLVNRLGALVENKTLSKALAAAQLPPPVAGSSCLARYDDPATGGGV